MKPSNGQTLAKPDTSSESAEAIRQFLVEAGTVYRQEISRALIGIWQREVGHISEPALRQAMSKTLQSCRFFPTPADVLGHVPLIDKFPDMAKYLGDETYSGPRQIAYPKPAPMTAEELKEHNAETIGFRVQIGPSRRPKISKEELQESERKLSEHETDAGILARLEEQKKILKERGLLS